MTQTAKLTASDGESQYAFGMSVAISGNTIVVGAPLSDYTVTPQQGQPYGITQQGTAYVFTQPASGWKDMTQTAELVPSDGSSDENFGHTVAISGDTVVIGAGSAAAYVFTEPAPGWANMTQTAELTADNSVDIQLGLGWDVAISGDTVVVSAARQPLDGLACVFVEPASGWTNMTQTALLTVSDPDGGDDQVYSVAISGDTAVLGAPNATVGTTAFQGAAYVFTEPASGWANMTQTARLTATDGGVYSFGDSVAVSGEVVVVGTPQAMVGPNEDQGAAYVYAEPDSGWAGMTQTAKLTASDGWIGDHLGWSVSIVGNTVVAGADAGVNTPTSSGTGVAYVFAVPAGAAPSVAGITATTGPSAGGTTVTITGSGFTGATLVSFGTVAATSFTVNAAGTQITAVSPAGVPGTVDVTVVTAGGTSVASAADRFTYIGPPPGNLGVFNAGYWYRDINGDNQWTSADGPPLAFGPAGATPVTGDWDGSGKTEIGYYLNGTWYLDTTSGVEQFTFGFTGSNVVPVVGDWDGDGKTEVGVYCKGAWFRDVDGSHTWDAANQAALAYLGWDDGGTNTVIPVPGYWAGDGKTEMGVYCKGVWFVDSTGSGQWDGGYSYWGWDAALTPVVGNWGGNGNKDHFGVYYQGVWFRDLDGTHAWDAANQAAVAYFGWSVRSRSWATG